MSLAIETVLLSLIAGLATVIGAIIVLAVKKIGNRVVSFSMGFASGVMLMVAFNNLFLEGQLFVTEIELISVFSLGALLMMSIDLIVPHVEPTAREANSKNSRMTRSGIRIAIGVALHNLPEGFVVAAGFSYNPTLGLIIAIAILMHNIPEGVATAIPFMEAGTKHSKIAVITLISGLAEPLGAIIGVIALSSMVTMNLIGYSLIFAAGVMTYITADELIPVAREYGYKHTVSVSLLLGIVFALLIDLILS